jgi:hypothetical protein
MVLAIEAGIVAPHRRERVLSPADGHLPAADEQLHSDEVLKIAWMRTNS